MSDDGGTTAFTITFKAGLHYDAPWVVVRGESTEELLVQLDALGKTGVIAKTVEVSTELQGVYAAAQGLPSKPVAVETIATTAAPFPTTPVPLALVPQAPVAVQSGPLCQHGQMVLRNGTKNNLSLIHI